MGMCQHDEQGCCGFDTIGFAMSTEQRLSTVRSRCSAETDVQVPLEKAWQLWENRELIPKWMPWIRSVTVQPDDPSLSRWLLATHQFGRDWQFSWLAKNLTPMQNQKVGNVAYQPAI